MTGCPASQAMTMPFCIHSPRKLSIDDYVQGVLSGNRTVLARAITLIESNSPPI